MPKKNRRNSTKNPALDPAVNLPNRTELLDYDYIDKLNKKEKEWLNKFTEEYVNDVLDRNNLKNNLHNTEALKKDCDDRNNSRNRDILTRQKSAGILGYLEEEAEPAILVEDSLIEKIDNSNAKNEKKTRKV